MKLQIVMLSLLMGAMVYGQSNKVIGLWLTDEKDAKIQIYKQGNKFHGKIIWLKNPNDVKGQPNVDYNNPNVKLKSRPILNIKIIEGMSYDDGEWTGGTIYDPNNGKSYDCTLWIEDGKLYVRGYLGWFFDTRTWTKVSA